MLPGSARLDSTQLRDAIKKLKETTVILTRRRMNVQKMLYSQNNNYVNVDIISLYNEFGRCSLDLFHSFHFQLSFKLEMNSWPASSKQNNNVEARNQMKINQKINSTVN